MLKPARRHRETQRANRPRGQIKASLSPRTAKTYWNWIKRFILFHDATHPAHLKAQHVNEFLSHLASERDVAASTQGQAKNAVVFLYRDVLNIKLGDFGEIVKAKRPKRIPVVLSPEEVLTILSLMHRQSVGTAQPKPGINSLATRRT